jgi:GAF domain-containing protein/ketosteroid isomerase-like protein
MGLAELSARYHRAFNDRDFDVWREVFAEDVELVVDGMTFRGVDAAVAYGVGSATQFPGLHIGSERVVAESRDTVVSEIELVNGDPASGRFRRQGTTCEISQVRDGRIVSCRSYYMAAAEGENTVRVPARGEATRVAQEQTALRRVATLVARGVSQDEIFAAVSQEIGWLVGADPASLMRFEPDDAITLVAAWSARRADFPIGASQPVNEDLRAIRESGRPWRWGPAELPSTGPFVEEARELGIRTSVGVPIVVEGRVWGFAFASSTTDQPFAVDAEARIAAFTELVAMAISNAQARAEARRLGDEQAALRRVATLVARERPPAEIFATVGEEVGRVLPVEDTAVLRYEHDGTATIVATWGGLAGVRAGTRSPVDGENVAALVARTGRPARIDDYATASGALGTRMRELGVGAAVGCPIAVEGRLWGAMIAAQRRREPLPADTEPRLANFSDLVASAIANTQTRTEVRRLADEQAALRRVATVVARQPSPDEVFAAVTKEVGTLLRVEHSYMWRYEPDGSATMVAYWGELDTDVTAGTRQTLEGESVAALVLRSERPARIDDYASATGSIAEYVRGLGVRSAVGAPIVIEGRLWGSMVAASGRAPSLPTSTEARMGEFTELVATAISNIQARGEVVRLLEEQAALRRVATLVAEAASPSALFGVVVEEVGRLFRCDLAGMIHYESGGTVTATATWAAQGEHPPVVGSWSLEGDRLATAISRTARPAREDDWDGVGGPIAEFVRGTLGIASSVGAPIVVEGSVWGALFVHSKEKTEPLPAGTESRLMDFTELVATAMSNAQARGEVHRLAHEQAALRRVATLVAEERPAAEVFAAVAEEVGRVLQLEDTRMVRFEDDGTATVVASWGELAGALPVGASLSLAGESASALVLRTGRPVRIDDFTNAEGSLAAFLRDRGVRSAVGAPIVVDGRLWGAMSTASLTHDPLPADTEARMGQFTELVATAISNIEARSDLAASRARIVAAADDERRRVVRDLHDGAQQRLVHTVITLNLAQQALEQGSERARVLLDESIDHARRATAEVRELAHGILPSALTHGGLRAGVDALSSRMPVPVAREVSVERLPSAVEATAYFVVAEALTNVAKHARAEHAEVRARVEHDVLRVQVRDDGVGGARPEGSGLVGLADRLAALDGRLEIESPAEGGTLVAATIPLAGEPLS